MRQSEHCAQLQDKTTSVSVHVLEVINLDPVFERTTSTDVLVCSASLDLSTDSNEYGHNGDKKAISGDRHLDRPREGQPRTESRHDHSIELLLTVSSLTSIDEESSTSTTSVIKLCDWFVPERALLPQNAAVL